LITYKAKAAKITNPTAIFHIVITPEMKKALRRGKALNLAPE
jgi:hypothetical protein